jgi:hypothetical protein
MRLWVAPWIALIAGVVIHASGVLHQIGPVMDDVDKILGTVTDVRKLIPQQQPIIVPKHAQHHSARKTK